VGSLIAPVARPTEAEPVSLFSAQAEAHLTEIASSIRKQTLADKRKALQVLRAWLGADMEVTAVPRKLGGRYPTESLLKSVCAAKRIQTRLSHVSSFWNWMLARGVGEVNPRLRISSTLPPVQARKGDASPAVA
jgi:site-specific recombinase XerD